MRFDIQRYVGNEEMTNVPELISRIILSMQTDGEVLMFTKEAFSAYDFGLVKILEDLIQFNKWNKDKIFLEYTNFEEIPTIDSFNVSLTQTYNSRRISADLYPIKQQEALPWTGEYDFGMFTGRLNLTRLCALENYRNFKYNDRGITSMNQSPASDDASDKKILEYLKASNTRWSDIKDLQPYSDIGEIIAPPITPKHQKLVDWATVYSKIAIDVVCETSEAYSDSAVTEKLVRCMVYKRPFLLIGSPGSFRAIKRAARNIGGLPQPRFFENVIPANYDNLYGKERVDAVFELLENLIASGKIDTILDDCRDDIESNYKLVTNVLARA